MENQRFMGVVGVDDTRSVRHLGTGDAEILETVVEIISTFLLSRRKEEQKERYIKALWDILNLQTAAIYIIRPDTYEIVAYNKGTEEIFPGVREKEVCFRCFNGRNRPCEECPLQFLLEGESEKTLEIYGEPSGTWSSATAKWVDWPEYGRCVAVERVDITRYKGDKEL